MFQAGDGPFLERCYTSSHAIDADGYLFLYRSARDDTNYRTFVSRLRAPSLVWQELIGSDHLGQGLTTGRSVRRGQGSEAERDTAIPNSALGDEWFSIDPSGGGKWEKYAGTAWERT